MIQKLYIRILNSVYNKYISRIDENVRNTHIWFIFVIIFAYFILFYSSGLKSILYTHLQREIFASFLLFAVSLFSIDRPLKPMKWKKSIIYTMFLSGIGLVVTGAIHPIGDGYMFFGIMLLTVFPCLYIVWINRQDYETFFDIVAKANVCVSVIYFIYCACLFINEHSLYDGERYAGTTPNNPNLFGLIGMTAMCTSTYLLLRSNSSYAEKAFYAFAFISGMIIVIMGQSRSSIFVGLMGLLMASIYKYKTKRALKSKYHDKSANNKIRKGFVILLMLIVVIIGLIIFSEPSLNGFFERFSFKDKSIDAYSSGRITLWNNYYRHLNLLGNNFELVDWDELTGRRVGHAHNNFLEFGYRSGIIVAFLFVLTEFLAGIKTLKILISKKYVAECYMFPLIFMIMYAVDSLLDIATIPMERYAPFFFYISLCAIIDPHITKGNANPI